VTGETTGYFGLFLKICAETKRSFFNYFEMSVYSSRNAGENCVLYIKETNMRRYEHPERE
jgi:hypothetical protein